MGKQDYRIGDLYCSIGKSSAITTNPYGSIQRTITGADHRRIVLGEILFLVDYIDMDDAGIWVWLHHDRLIWQVMRKELFDLCWEKVDLDDKNRT